MSDYKNVDGMRMYAPTQTNSPTEKKAIFIAIMSTEDRRITKGNKYLGDHVYLTKAKAGRGWRVRVIDNTGGLMTFDPAIFRPPIVEML